jgi:multidrug resistance protein, MATE family
MSQAPAITNDSEHRPSLKKLLHLAWPVVLTRSTQSIIGLSDALMVARLGADALAATATGALNTFTVAIVPFGIVFIVQSFSAQLAGRREFAASRRYAIYGLVIAVITSLIAIAVTPFAGSLLAPLNFPPAVHLGMTEYMQFRLWSLGAFVATEAFGNWFAGLGDTRVPMRASVIAMVSNIMLDWVLIFGNLGAPAMGIAGNALASGLANCIGLAYIAAAYQVRQRELSGGEPLGLRLREFLRMLRFGIPNGINWFMEMGAFTLYINVIVATLGTHVLAAMNVILQLNSVSFMPAFGLTTAGAILVGQAIGAGARDQVGRIVWLTLRVTLVWQCGVGLLYLFAPKLLLWPFTSGVTDGAAVLAVGAAMLAVSAAWQFFDSIGMTVGEALRAAGDTAWCMWARLASAWLLFVPLGWWVVARDGGHSGAMWCIVVYLAVLAVALALRFTNGAWRRIELVEPSIA